MEVDPNITIYDESNDMVQVLTNITNNTRNNTQNKSNKSNYSIKLIDWNGWFNVINGTILECSKIYS